MKSETILFSGNSDVAAPLLKLLKESKLKFLHLPLEPYQFEVDEEEHEQVLSKCDNYAFVVYGNLRNARFFMQWMFEHDKLSEFKEKVHLAADQPTAEFLEKNGLPAIIPKQNARPIDVLEFVLHISYQGAALYPCTDQKAEEIPGLYKELEMPVGEFSVCRENSLEETTLEKYRKCVAENRVDTVLFHNRSSVVRLKTAFPKFDFHSCRCLSGSPGVSEKMAAEGLTPFAEADGNWVSMAKMIKEVLK